MRIASHLGATVTGVCRGDNVGAVRALGAEHGIDYTKRDLRSIEDRYDVVFETAGSMNCSQALDLVKPGGRVALIAGGLGDLLWASRRARSRGCRALVGPAAERRDDLERMVDLATRGVFSPLIERVYPFDRIAEAHARVQSRRKVGNVVISFE